MQRLTIYITVAYCTAPLVYFIFFLHDAGLSLLYYIAAELIFSISDTASKTLTFQSGKIGFTVSPIPPEALPA